MEKILNNGEYIAPEINVIEIKSQEVLCASGNQQKYDDGTWTW